MNELIEIIIITEHNYLYVNRNHTLLAVSSVDKNYEKNCYN